MSLEVYFDDTLIDELYYTELTNNNELFNDSFKLGSTPSNTYKLKIAKEAVSNHPFNVILKDDGGIFAILEIDNIEEQDYTYEYTLTDKMIDLDFYYDASLIFTDGSTTLYNIVTDICNRIGLNLGTHDFRGYDKEISWYDNTRTARQYIGYIAELNGGFARIENNTLYFIKQKTDSKKVISLDECENFTIGEYHKITRVVYELGTVKYEFGDMIGNTLYLDSENVFITEESEVEEIYNDLKDFEFYSFEIFNCPIDYSIKAGDVITFTDNENNYPTIAQYDLEYFGGWIGGYNLSVNTERQEETKLIGYKEKIKNLDIIVNRHDNSITQIVEEQNGAQEQINSIIQDANSTTQKIEDIENDTNSKIEELKVSIDGVSNKLTKNGGNNIFYYDISYWLNDNEDEKINLVEFTDTEIKGDSVSGMGYIVNSGSAYQNVEVQNDTYTISFKYKKIGPELANAYVKINGEEYSLTATDWTDFIQTIDVTANYITVEFISDTDDTLYITDLLGNIGTEKNVWTQNPNETRTDTVTIGKGIKVENTEQETFTKIDADGTRIYNKNNLEKPVTEFTKDGTETEELIVKGQAQISGILIKQQGNQTWISSLL